MGTVFSAGEAIEPKWREPPTFEPLYGFPEGRKERVMKVTEEEMEAAGVNPEYRDYCAHHIIDLLKCRRDKYPWVSRCAHEKHLWDDCQFQDHVLRMKEYERERRLLERAKRKAEKEAREAGDE